MMERRIDQDEVKEQFERFEKVKQDKELWIYERQMAKKSKELDGCTF